MTLAALMGLLVACGAPQPSSSSEASEREGSASEDGAEQPTPEPEPNGGSANCVPEGGTAYTLHERQCCEGLTFLAVTGPPVDGQCIEAPPGPSPGTCVSTCGDGSCDAPENPCNCGGDCPASSGEAEYSGPEQTLCGCGCCGGGGGPGEEATLPPIECVPNQAEFDRRVAADARASRSARCAAAGCSIGVRLRVCAP